MELIKFENYSFAYACGEKDALLNINLSVLEKEILVVCGKSGSGKSTLLRTIKQEITPKGTHQGEKTVNIDSKDIAIVFQNADTSLVHEKVIDDLVFHMENLQYDQITMRKQLAETVSFFGIGHLLHKDNFSLSGGERQLIALCSALMTRPKILLLDEPTSQLDPIATREFWDIIYRIYDEFSITIIVTEHRLEDISSFATKVVLMENGEIVNNDYVKKAFKSMDKTLFIPHIPRLSLALNLPDIFFKPREIKEFIEETNGDINIKNCCENETILKIDNLFFAYEKDFVIKDLSLSIFKGEKICLFGGNGSGKSTLLKLISNILKPYSGKVKRNFKKIAYIPQDINSYFRFDSVLEELTFSASKENKTINDEIVDKLCIKHLLNRHPFDLSGGEAQKVVLACVLHTNPEVIIMDEPTKGLDPYAKEDLKGLLNALNLTIIMSTHDTNFGAEFSSRCILLFDGSIYISEEAHKFFSQNHYYTTQINLALRHKNSEVITFKEALSLCLPL